MRNYYLRFYRSGYIICFFRAVNLLIVMSGTNSDILINNSDMTMFVKYKIFILEINYNAVKMYFIMFDIL